MLLAIDVGNSNIVIGVYEGNNLIDSWRVSTDLNKTSDEYGMLFSQLLSFHNVTKEEIEDIIIASVVPPLNYTLPTALFRATGKQPLLAGEDVKFNVKLDLELAGDKVGADRLANVIAAMDRHSVPMIIVDIGTAITLDYVSKDGVYSGGMIAPGIRIAAEALFSQTAQLPNVEIVKPERAMAKDTVSAMQSGLVYGFTGLIDKLIEKILEEENLDRKDVTCIYTGGFSHLIAENSKFISIIDRNLTLDGLRILYEKFKA